MTDPILACPHDGGDLLSEPDALLCATCGRSYQREGNVLSFLDTPDDFYEGTYRNTIHYLPADEGVRAIPLWAIHNGYLWQARKHVPAGSRVLEFGCAAGVAYFGRRYEMIGLDVSLSSLREASPLYSQCLAASAIGRLPLQDASVDAVFSAYFWEHMPPDVKPGILAECHRVLKPGGRLVFLYDVETQNPLIDRVRTVSPALYQSEFLDGDGHVGYETIEANRAGFRAAGFDIEAEEPQERTWVQSPSVFAKTRRWPASRLTRLSAAIDSAQRPLVTRLHTVAVRAVDSTLGQLTPESWARITLTVARKR